MHPTVLALIEEADIAEDYTLAMIEPNVERPVLPFNGSSINSEAHTLRLSNINGFDISPIAAVFVLNEWNMIVGRWSSIQWTTDLWNVNMNDFFRICVKNGAEV